jgi:hypothetical protein
LELGDDISDDSVDLQVLLGGGLHLLISVGMDWSQQELWEHASIDGYQVPDHHVDQLLPISGPGLNNRG